MKHFWLRHIILFLLALYSLRGYGQQDPMFTQYMNNPLLINPAYAGSLGNLNINGIFRKQWVGLEWQPTTTSFSVNTPFRNYDVGLGAIFLNDKIGPLQQTGIYFDYSYYIDFEKNRRLAMGIMVGFNYYQKNLIGLPTYDEDPWVKLHPTGSKFLFNSGLGLYYSTNDYFVGASIPKLLRNSYSDKDDTYELVGKEERHFYLTGGAIFDINEILKIKPSTMIRLVNGAPASLDIAATAILLEQFWFGLTYRIEDAVAAHIRIQMNARLQIGYSYDLNNSRLRSSNFGTHEVFLSYTFTRKGEKILSPRYF